MSLFCLKNYMFSLYPLLCDSLVSYTHSPYIWTHKPYMPMWLMTLTLCNNSLTWAKFRFETYIQLWQMDHGKNMTFMLVAKGNLTISPRDWMIPYLTAVWVQNDMNGLNISGKMDFYLVNYAWNWHSCWLGVQLMVVWWVMLLTEFQLKWWYVTDTALLHICIMLKYN